MNPSGLMLLYNDSLWLAKNLRHFTGTEFRRSGQVKVDSAETEISALELFAIVRTGERWNPKESLLETC